MAKRRAKAGKRTQPRARSTGQSRKRLDQQKSQVIARPALRVLSLDTSSTCVGWSLFENGELLKCGKQIQQGKKHGEKLAYFYTWLTGLFAEHKPDVVCFEMPFAGRRKNTFGILMFYIAVVLLVHFEHFGYELAPENMIRARDVKSINRMAKLDSHEAYKADAVRLVNSLYGTQLKYDAKDSTKKRSDDDVADAILINRAFHIRLVKQCEAKEDADGR